MTQPNSATLNTLLETDPALYQVLTKAAGPVGQLPLTEEMLRQAPSGDLFGLTQNAGMGWTRPEVGRHDLSHPRAPRGASALPDGKPIALGYHTGHWEVGLLVTGGGRGAAALAGSCRSPAWSPTRATAGPRAPPA